MVVLPEKSGSGDYALWGQMTEKCMTKLANLMGLQQTSVRAIFRLAILMSLAPTSWSGCNSGSNDGSEATAVSAGDTTPSNLERTAPSPAAGVSEEKPSQRSTNTLTKESDSDAGSERKSDTAVELSAVESLPLSVWSLEHAGCIGLSETSVACIVSETIVMADADLGRSLRLYAVPLASAQDMVFLGTVACKGDEDWVCEEIPVDREKAQVALRQGGFRPLIDPPVSLTAGRLASVGEYDLQVRLSGEVCVQTIGDDKCQKVGQVQKFRQDDFPVTASVVSAAKELSPPSLVLVTASWPDFDSGSQEAISLRTRILALPLQPKLGESQGPATALAALAKQSDSLPDGERVRPHTDCPEGEVFEDEGGTGTCIVLPISCPSGTTVKRKLELWGSHDDEAEKAIAWCEDAKVQKHGPYKVLDTLRSDGSEYTTTVDGQYVGGQRDGNWTYEGGKAEARCKYSGGILLSSSGVTSLCEVDFAQPASAPMATHEVYNTSSDPKEPWLALRDHPKAGKGALTTAQMPDGTKLKLAASGEERKGWLRVEVVEGPLAGKTGYANGKWIREL